MPDDPTQKADQDDAAAIAARAAAPAAPAQPEYMTAAAFAEYQRKQDERWEQLTERIVTAATPREQPKTETVINYDAEIAKAEEEGNSGRATELRIDKATKPLRDRIANYEQFGIRQLESISSEVAISNNDDKRLYQRYKKEVDSVRAGMPAEFRTSPESLRTALIYVKGQHFDELMAEKQEALAREAAGRKDTTGSTPSATESQRAKKLDRLPTVEEYFEGDEKKVAQVEALGGPDKFAQKVSGGRNKTWEEWVTKSLRLVGKPVPEKKGAAA